VNAAPAYPARLEVDYPEQLNRLTTALRLVWIIPIAVIAGLLTGTAFDGGSTANDGTTISIAGASSLPIATALMIAARQKYPRWWFDFARELVRFEGRVGAYFALLTDQYPSTTDTQSVHLEIDYPENVETDLNRWLPLVKWLLAIPHFLVLLVLGLAAFVCIVIAWFAILFTGQYPRGLFAFVVGVGRWGLRVQAYAFLMLTDSYPPFSLDR
jgi:hypothetical protein